MSKQFGLIGHPLGHSLSPEIHNRLFDLSGYDGKYDLFDISPEDFSPPDFLTKYNVTIPYKTKIIPYLDSLSDSASRFGAVNAVCEGTGHNTDVTGFLKACEKKIPLTGEVCLLGCGGAGRMMARCVLLAGGSLTVAVRDIKSPSVVSFQAFMENSPYTLITFSEVEKDCFDTLLNSTPVGMYPNTDISPLAAEQLRGVHFLFDAIYNPTPTLLMAQAVKSGAKTVVGGMRMLVWQAAAAHEIWYDAKFTDRDIDIIIGELSEGMAEQYG